MDIKELTQIMVDLVHAKGWDDQINSKKHQTMRNLAISLSLEAAEVLEHFQWSERPANKKAFAAELADVSLYLLQLAHVADIDLEKAILDKVAVNYKRTWDETQERPEQ